MWSEHGCARRVLLWEAPSEQLLPVAKGMRWKSWALQGEGGKRHPGELTQPTGQGFVYHHPLTASSRREEVRKKKEITCPSPTSLERTLHGRVKEKPACSLRRKRNAEKGQQRTWHQETPWHVPAGLVRLFIAASIELLVDVGKKNSHWSLIHLCVPQWVFSYSAIQI